jgi:hypothetical protein
MAAADVAGVWLTVTADAGQAHLMHVTNPISELLAELQLTVGEGPSLDAAASGGPALAPDLRAADAAGRWPAFAPAAGQAGAAAVFAFPLLIGAIRVGALGMYRERPGSLSASQLDDALTLAGTATVLLLESQQTAARGTPVETSPSGQPAGLALQRAEIDQATGMLTEQLGKCMADAFLRLRAYAYVQDRRIADVARDIVARRLRLCMDPDLSGDGKT